STGADDAAVPSGLSSLWATGPSRVRGAGRVGWGLRGYEAGMSDYSEHGTEPVEDAAVADPPTEEEVRAAQERDHPDQAATALHGDPPGGGFEPRPAPDED